MRKIFVIAMLAIGALAAPALADSKGKGGKGNGKPSKGWVERYPGPPPWAPAKAYRSKYSEYGQLVPPRYEWRYDGYQWQYVPIHVSVWIDDDEWDDFYRWKQDKQRLKELREQDREEYKAWREHEKESSRWQEHEREYRGYQEELPPPPPDPWQQK